MTGVSEPEEISTKLQRMAELASKKDPKMVLTSLAQHIDLNWLIAAHRMTRKDGAVGIDGQTAKDYSLQLVDNLRGLLERFKSGSYRAPAVKRVLIPKGDGKTRPIGIPTYEDKVLQRAVVMVLDEVYEQDFLDCSYGFRCGRGAHQALDVLWKGLMSMGGGFVLEIDIESFFDTLVHKHLGEFLDQRVRDGVIRRAIGKWLKAGVLDKGQWLKSEQGSPQGGVISPLLANIYLHEVLDVWFEHDVKPQLKGKAFMVRYADDAALVFANEEDAQRVYKIIAARFEKYGLKLHPTKTRLIDFRSPRRGNGEKPETFDMLGFTHYPAQDEQQELQACPTESDGVVSVASARLRRRSARRTLPQSQRPLRLLRSHGKQSHAQHVRPHGRASLAQVARSPVSTRQDDLGALQATAEAPPIASGVHCTLIQTSSSEAVV